MANHIVHTPVHSGEIMTSSKQNIHSPSTHKQRILVMDDEINIRLMLDKILSRLGYEVETVENGELAIELYKETYSMNRPFDLVIMDLTIPGSIGGKKAISQLLEFDPNTRAIVISGYSNDQILINYKHYGFCGVISKPFQLVELQKVLDSVL